MKGLLKNIALFATLLVVGCNNSFDESDLGEGLLTMNIEVDSSSVTRSSDDLSSAILDNGVIKVYNSNGDLVRYYSDLTETIVDYLAVGTYDVEFKYGTTVYATFETDAVNYYGKKDDVAILSNQTTEVEIEVTMQNIILSVDIDDATLSDKFTDYSVKAYAADTIDDVNSDTPTLIYDSTKDGYFVLPDGVSNIIWQFVDNGTIEAEGTIEGAQMTYQYKLTFKYSDYLDVENLVVDIEELEEHDDSFDFKVQPVFSGVDFDVVQNYTNSSIELSISTIASITNVEVTVGTETYSSAEETSGVVFSAETNTLSLTSDLFDTFTMGGIHELELSATDSNGAVGHADMFVGLDGFSGVKKEDFWYNTADVTWYTTTPSTNVTMQYKYSSDEDWSDVVAATSTDGGYSWSATTQPTWSSSTNSASLAVSQLARGYRPSVAYDYKITIDGTENEVSATSSATTQTITSGDLDDSNLSCYKTTNTEATFWASGNNDFTSSLCAYYSSGSVQCAKLTTAYYLMTASGNLFTGVFSQSGTSGTASFGQPFTWTARPKSMKVSYMSSNSGSDMGRVFVAIVDWSSRHGVKVGFGVTSTGIWDPTSQIKTDEGNIIGYGSFHASSSVSTMTELEIPIYYYDNVTKPTGNYTIVISCASSYDGDNKNGETGNTLYVDDFEFVY
ncbi:MAG: PCMD domain-containing protein [Rikenellaceae bacterium]